MFKGNKKFIYIFLALFAMIVAVQYMLPKPTDWSRNYLAKSKSPFGCYAIYNLLDDTYAATTTNNTQTLYNLNAKGQQNTSLLIINNKIDFNASDMKSLYSFLQRGNTVFIAAGNFNGALADSLHLRTEVAAWHYYSEIDSLISKTGETISFTAKNISAEAYPYPQLALSSHFTSFDTTKFRVMAYYGDKRACLIKGSVNKGTLYLMSIPDAFGNYFIANHKNRRAAYTMLSCLKNENLVWDEYYKTFNITNYSAIKFILDSDALYTAYLLMIIVIVFYMIFEGRRRQRAVPLLVKPANSTLEFVNVISHVYYSSKNHHHITSEKIKYFYEMVRKKFGMDTGNIDEAFISEVSELSGVPGKTVKQLFAYTEKIRQSADVTDLELAELNRQIHNFNKNSLR